MVSFVWHGLLTTCPMTPLNSIMGFSKSAVTKLDVVRLIQAIHWVEITTGLMEVSTLALLLLPYPLILPMDSGHFSGLGLEELSNWVTTTVALITSCQEDLLDPSLILSIMEEITPTLGSRNACFSTLIDFMFVSMNLVAMVHTQLLNQKVVLHTDLDPTMPLQQLQHNHNPELLEHNHNLELLEHNPNLEPLELNPNRERRELNQNLEPQEISPNPELSNLQLSPNLERQESSLNLELLEHLQSYLVLCLFLYPVPQPPAQTRAAAIPILDQMTILE